MTLEPARVERSDDAARFPWPFVGAAYRYSANLEPAPEERRTTAGSWGASIIDVDSHYEAESSERRQILAADPSRATEVKHMRWASWETLLYVLQQLSDTYPDVMRLTTDDGSTYQWHNTRLGCAQEFEYGSDESLPVGPLLFAASQIQEDLVLLDEREGTLYADAGVVTFASNWSMAFNTGMTFLEIHGPVPRNYADGAIPRAEAFLKRLPVGQAYRRLNWTSTIGKRLDTSIETYNLWGAERYRVGPATVGSDVSLRVEVQHVVRLPATNAIIFFIRTYFLSLEELAAVPGWAGQCADVLTALPQEMADYKGWRELRGPCIAWLRAASDRAPIPALGT